MWQANREAHAVDPKSIALLLDLDGNLTECVGANFALLSDKTIHSPARRGRLEGVTLNTLRQLAGQLGLSWEEGDLQPYDAMNAEEAFITTTPWCVAPCVKVNNAPVGSGKPGPIFGQIMDAWSQMVGIDVHRQLLGLAAEPIHV